MAATDAETDARRAGGGFLQRLVHRARAVTEAEPLERALEQVRHATLLIVVAGCLVGLVLGAGAARAGLGAEREAPVNFYFALASLLGVQTIVLIIWVALMLAGPRALAAGSLGGAATGLGRWLAGKLHRGPHQLAAIETTARWIARGPMARWTFGAITHAMWLSFNVGCLIALLLLLSARRYTFAWETTILDEEAYVALTGAIATAPRMLGFSAPTADEIRESEWLGEGPLPDEHREEWSDLLVGSVVVYGLAPRLVLLVGCLGRRRLVRRRLRLDESRPGYARLRPRLMPETAPIGVVDPAGDGASVAGNAPPSTPARPAGPPAVVGLEIDAPLTTWPPPVPGVRWDDLGFVDSGADRRRVIERLVTSTTEPGAVVVVCGLTTTPDRGHAAFLASLRGALSKPPVILLTAGQALRERGNGALLEQRIDDWKTTVSSVGVTAEGVVEIDLDHLTDHSATHIGTLIGAAPGDDAPPARAIEAAFGVIIEHVRGWTAPPDTARRAELHRAIADVYRRRGATAWRDWLPSTSGGLDDVATTLRSGADRFVAMLPPRLKASPKWLAAGAAAGALGCVAAATMLAPVAIAALPTWSAIGAGLGALIQPRPKDDATTEAPSDALGDAVRSAALFAMLLELQGREETAIGRILDEVVDDDETPSQADAVAAWLDQLRHRLDMAVAREVRS